jgi:hypothetical protein
MLRTGRFSARDKLRMLKDYWNTGATPDLGATNSDSGMFRRWQNYARTEGLRVLGGRLAERSATPRSRIDRQLAQLDREVVIDFVDAKIRGREPPEIPSALTTRIMRMFENAALIGLQWTFDEGEVPTVDIVRDRAGPFPTEFVHQNQRTVCFNCARFFGRNEVIHLHEVGASRVTLVDTDEQRLEEMRLLYPENWDYVATADYGDFLQHAATRGERYGLAVADPPWRNKGDDFAWLYLPTIMRLCSTYITTYWADMFETLGCQMDDLPALSAAVSQKTGIRVEFLRILRRTHPTCWAAMQAAK